ncbi:5-formyltetrahydrofolate cyclo-ligase [Cohaesibacter celericrescens]|uniref:5-formyltetrahydrofolate cyclo-ligase n=1 Tax=Cohaesibacter celericrescens TaxID=2067669 RepID=A0A2N5XLB7_9HYPH|nr:5-formyltetrahydrofolate cyclo-ligase [Cohaesibacter celericrescens]PLW75227.1 5-formyltetrahydrofolate cyclo-ligase [Cohaesibacter celericrescens]
MDSTALKEHKATTRREMTRLRDELPIGERERQSTQACQQLLDRLAVAQGQVIGLFLPIKSEINASMLVEPLRERGARLALPVPIGRTGMIFRAWERDAPLVDAGFGTVGPEKTAEELIPDCLIMPLLAFDARGDRLGYGAGHYDRYISERIIEGRKPQLIGLAFSFQKLDKVPVGSYDLPLDMIVTERGVYTP